MPARRTRRRGAGRPRRAREAPPGEATAAASPQRDDRGGSHPRADPLAAVAEDGLQPRSACALLFVFYVVQVGIRLFLSRIMEVPTLYHDGMGYLGNARVLAGLDGPQFAPGTVFVHFGYSLLLAPLYWLLAEPLEVFHWALRVNAVVASALVFVLYALARSLFGLGRAAALWSAALASVYPALLLHSNFVWTENVLPLLFALWLLAATACARRRTAPSAVLFALVGGALYMVHPRGLPMALLSLAFLGWLCWSGRLRRGAAIVAAIALAGVLVATALLGQELHRQMWSLGRAVTSAQMASRVVRFAKWPEYLLGAVGQTWALLASTLGLAALGFWALLRQAFGSSEPDDQPRRAGARLALAATAATFGLSVLMVAGGRRVDHLVYLRYNEIFVPVLLLPCVGWLLAEGPRLADRVLAVGAAVLPLTPVVAYLRVGSPYADLVMPLCVLGLLPYQALVGTLEFPAIGLGAAGCALGFGILLRWRARVALVALGLACLWATWLVQRSYVTRYAEIFPRTHTLQHVIRQMAADAAVAYDTGTAQGEYIHAYQFHSPDRPAVLFDSSREGPPADLVVASKEWAASEALGAELVAVEDLNDHALWVLPGPVLDALRSRQIVKRYEAEALPTQVADQAGRRAVVRDSRASGGKARLGAPEMVTPGMEVALVYGPYGSLVPGRYEVRFRLAGNWGDSPVLLDVCADAGTRILASSTAPAAEGSAAANDDYRLVSVSFSNDELVTDIEFRVFYAGAGEVRVDYVETALTLEERGPESQEEALEASGV
jgi:hypothetical protein